MVHYKRGEHRRLMKRLAIFSVLFIFLGVGVWGAEFTWTGLGDPSDWNDPYNWDVGAVPSAVDDVIIDNASVVLNISPITIASLEIKNGGTFDIAGNSFNVEEIKIDYGTLLLGTASLAVVTLEIGTTGAEINTGTDNLSVSGMTTLNGELKLDGELIITNLTAGIDGEVTDGTLTGNVTMNGATVTIDTNDVDISGASVSTGILNVGGRDIFINATGDIEQTGVITTTKILTVDSGDSITLDEKNEVATLEIIAAGDAVSFTNDAALKIAGVSNVGSNGVKITTTTGTGHNIEQTGAIITTGTLQLFSGGTIFQTGNSITAANLEMKAASGITLDEDNEVATLEITGAGDAVSFTNNAALEIAGVSGLTGTLPAVRDVKITTTTDGITQSGIIETSGTLQLNSDGEITLNSANEVAALEIIGAGGAVQFTNNAALEIAGVSGLAGSSLGDRNVKITTTAGLGHNITQTGAIETDETLTLNSGGAIILNEDNKVAALGITGAGGAVEFTNNAALSIVGVSVVSSLSVTATVIEVNADITTTGNQTYSGAVTLGANRIFTADAGSLIWFKYAVRSNDAIPHALTITNANVRFDGQVGGAPTPISTVTVNNGTATIGANITTSAPVTPAITQRYYGPVVLGASVTFEGGSAANAAIRFDGTVNGTYALTITNANVQFNREVGGSTSLSSVTVNSLPAGPVGTATINADITTILTQQYGAVTLGDNITLKGSKVTLGAITGDGNSLKIDGAAELNDIKDVNELHITGAADLLDEIEETDDVVSITVEGTAVLSGFNAITTSGDQTYKGITLGTGPLELTSGGAVEINGAISITTDPDITVNAKNGIDINDSSTTTSRTIELNNNPGLTQSGDVSFSGKGKIIVTGVNTANNPEGKFAVSTDGDIEVAAGGIIAGGAVTLTTTGGDIKISGTIESLTLALSAITGTVNIGNTSDPMISVSGGNNTEFDHNANAGVYIKANSLTGSGKIRLLSSQGMVCAFLSVTSSYNVDNVTGRRIHFHTSDHIVYSSGPDTDSYGITGDYLYLNASSNLGTVINYFTTDSGNIYIIDVDDGDQDNPALTRTVNFSTDTGGYIEIRGAYTSSGALNLSAGTGGIRLLDADIELTGNNFNTNGALLTLLDGTTNDNSIKAANITLGGGIAAEDLQDLTLETAGNVVITGDVGTNTAPLGNFTVINTGVFTAGGNITADEKVDVSGEMVSSVNIIITGADIELNRVTSTGKLTINNSGEFTANAPIASDGGFEQNNDGGNSVLKAGANITTDETDIIFTDVITLDASVTLSTGNTGDGDISLTANIESAAAQNLTLTAGTGDITVGGSIGSSTDPLGNITITSANDVTFSDAIDSGAISVTGANDITFTGTITATSFTQSAGTGTTTFNGAQKYSNLFSFSGIALTVNNDLETGNIIYIANTGDFTVSASSGILPGGVMTVTGNTSNGGSITAASIAGSPVVNFVGDYISTSTGQLIGGSATQDIQFGADVVLGVITTNNARLVFAGNGTLSIASPASSPVFENVLVKSGVTLYTDTDVKQTDGKILELEAGAVLDISTSSWHIGTSGTPSGDFAGINGVLTLGAGSKLIGVNINLTNTFTVNNTGWTTISAKGDVDIGGSVVFSANYSQLIIEMAGTGEQKLNASRALGSLHVGENSQTILNGSIPGTVSFRGEVIIYASDFPYGLDAGDHDIEMYAGISGNRDLTNYTHSNGGPDNIKYARWEIAAAYTTPTTPPFSSPPDMNAFVFRQNPGRKVSFVRDSIADQNVFFEIAGNTLWRTFECFEKGAVIQFSRHPHHHTILEQFSIMGDGNGSDDHSNYVTITRLTDDNSFPYIYDPASMPKPPLTPEAGGSASVGYTDAYGLPVYYPPLDLKADTSDEKKKYWNINLVSSAGNKPLDDFKYVRIFFSHAYNQRIPIETTSMFLDAIPYYRPQTGIGYFNFDWIELRKILYSFTEDSTGDGRLDRIRVQTNVRLNGNFDRFNVEIEGYEVDRTKGKNGFQLVSDLTNSNPSVEHDDEDSFYIYLRQNTEIDGGNTPLWNVTQNDDSLKDKLTENSPVGDPLNDKDIKPFDTIPPRVAFSLAVPGHPQVYTQMSEPVVSENGDDAFTSFNGSLYLNNARVLETTDKYNFTWKYIPLNDEPVDYVLPVESANLGYLLDLKAALGIEELAKLRKIDGDDTSSWEKGYFELNNMVDQAQRAMDWNDPAVDPAFYIYYQPPKYPLNWNYSGYAKVYGNSHLSGNGLTNPDFDASDRATDLLGGAIDIKDVFVPPHKMLTVDMMTKLAKGLANGSENEVKPGDFNSPNGSVIRRITDVLVSLTPGSNDSDSYFVWPVWARYQEPANSGNLSLSGDFWSQKGTDNGLIWDFDGTKFLEARDVEIQARLHSSLAAGMNVQLFWAADVAENYRTPQETAARGKGSGGLWLPDAQNNPMYSYNFLSGGSWQVLSHSSSFPLFNFFLNEGASGFSNGEKVDFIFRVIDNETPCDFFAARLDVPSGGAIPENWYRLVRPFSFDIQNIRLQRGGVTILNNVINSNNREAAYIRYHLVRPGRVTIQVYTLDGTLVKSLRRNEQREAGEWTDTWDGTNNGGRSVARGMYFVRVVGPDIDEIRKIMVVK